jgi:hypothetical protein
MYLMFVLYYIKLMLAFKNMFVLFRYGSQWFAIVPTVTILINNKELFVTKENPKLGLTNLVEHQIHLKPDAVSKHQRPYKLPLHKRDVLRHQLDELLSQGRIAPVNEKEHIPISSPIVLVSRRNRPNSGLETGSNEGSLLMSRFCVDFRYLNSNTQAF